MGQCLEVEGSSDGSTVVGGVVREAGGGGGYGIVTWLHVERRERGGGGDGEYVRTVVCVESVYVYITCTVDVFQKREWACMCV